MRTTKDGAVKLGILLLIASLASAETLTLETLITSKIPQGRFEARDLNGKIHRGHFISHPAKRWLRRGSVSLYFDEPLVVVNKDKEGMIRASRKKQLIVLGSSLALAKIVDDSVDTAIGASKARLIAAPAALLLMYFEKGGEVKLEPGYQFEAAQP